MRKIKITYKKDMFLNIIDYALVAVFIGLFLMRDIYDISVNKYIFLAIAIALFAFRRVDKIYEFLILISPLVNGLPNGYIFCFALIFILCKKRWKLNLKGAVICVALACIELCSGFRGDFSISEYIIYIGLFFVTFFFLLDCEKEYDYMAMCNGFLIGLTIAIVNILAQILKKYSITELLIAGIRIGDVYTNTDTIRDGIRLSFDQNELGRLCAMGIFISYILYQQYKSKRHLLPIALFSVIGIMTQSKTFLVVVVLGFLLIALITARNIAFLLGRLSTIALGMGALTVAAYYIVPTYVESFLKRFTVEDLTTGRTDIMFGYLDAQLQLPNTWLFGVGLQNYQEKYGMYISSHLGMHEVLLTWGIVGVILVVMLFVIVFANLKYSNSKQWLFAVPFIMLLVAFQSIQFFSISANIISLLPVYACANLHWRKQKNQTKIETVKL